MKTILVMTTICSKDRLASRAWAWYPTLAAAKRAFAGKEQGDFFAEHYYDYLVIEEVPAGVSFAERREEWFRWTNSRGWRPCKKPAFAKLFVFWGLG